MNTIVKDWQIVSVVDNGDFIGKVLWGTCVDDTTCRFARGDYICTSKIRYFSSKTSLIKTNSGSLYQVIGEGEQSKIEFKDFELLRNGFSPEQINKLNLAPNGIFH